MPFPDKLTRRGSQEVAFLRRIAAPAWREMSTYQQHFSLCRMSSASVTRNSPATVREFGADGPHGPLMRGSSYRAEPRADGVQYRGMGTAEL